MVVAEGVDWTNVLVALIAGLPAIIAAVGVLLVRQQIKTPSGKRIGAQVEDALHAAIANHHYVNAISDKVGAEPSPKADGEAQQVEALASPDVQPGTAGA